MMSGSVFDFAAAWIFVRLASSGVYTLTFTVILFCLPQSAPAASSALISDCLKVHTVRTLSPPPWLEQAENAATAANVLRTANNLRDRLIATPIHVCGWEPHQCEH